MQFNVMTKIAKPVYCFVSHKVTNQEVQTGKKKNYRQILGNKASMPGRAKINQCRIGKDASNDSQQLLAKKKR